MKKIIEAKAKVLYFFNAQNLECRTYYLEKITPNLRISETSETFKLDKPSFFENGIPIFIIVRDFPISIKMEMLSEKDNQKLIEKGYSASEIDAKINSMYVNHIFKKRSIEPQTIIVFILSICLSIISTLLFVKLTGFDG